MGDVGGTKSEVAGGSMLVEFESRRLMSVGGSMIGPGDWGYDVKGVGVRRRVSQNGRVTKLFLFLERP